MALTILRSNHVNWPKYIVTIQFISLWLIRWLITWMHRTQLRRREKRETFCRKFIPNLRYSTGKFLLLYSNCVHTITQFAQRKNTQKCFFFFETSWFLDDKIENSLLKCSSHSEINCFYRSKMPPYHSRFQQWRFILIASNSSTTTEWTQKLLFHAKHSKQNDWRSERTTHRWVENEWSLMNCLSECIVTAAKSMWYKRCS